VRPFGDPLLCAAAFLADQRAGVAVSRSVLVTVSVWPAGTTAEYSAVQHEGQQYWRNTMGAST
jgi:hypothetical protein